MNDDKNSPADKIVGSSDVLERDRMWGRSIIATQRVDGVTGRLVCDVDDLLHHFNEVERSNAVLSGAANEDEPKRDVIPRPPRTHS